MDNTNTQSKTLWCKEKGSWVIMQACITCRKFPCKIIPEDFKKQSEALKVEYMKDQGYVEIVVYKQQKEDRMLVKWKNGKIEEVDELAQDLETINKLECVYVISKVLYPTLTLKPKSGENGNASANAGTGGLVKRRKRRKKGEIEQAESEATE